MNPTNQLQKLLRAKKRTEKKLHELEQKIDHILFRLDEERRCFARKCPFTEDDQAEPPDPEH